MKSILCPILAFACLHSPGYLSFAQEEPPIFAKVEAYLKTVAEFEPAKNPAPLSEKLLNTLKTKRDPETKVGSIIFSIAKKSKQFLTPEQKEQWSANIAKFAETKGRWHDERNTLRVKFHRAMWDYIASSDANADAKRNAMSRWMDVWILWLQQEHMHHYRQAATSWEILTKEQRARLRAGEWDESINKNMGHSRNFDPAKTVSKALGQPENQSAFDAAAAEWQKKQNAIRDRFLEIEKRTRILSLHTDISDEAIFDAHWRDYAKHWRELFLTNAEAIRAICHAGYDMTKDRHQKSAAAASDKMLAKVKDKYTEAKGLLSILGDL